MKVHVLDMGGPLCNKRGECKCLTTKVFQRKGTMRCRDCRKLLFLIQRTHSRLSHLRH